MNEPSTDPLSEPLSNRSSEASDDSSLVDDLVSRIHRLATAQLQGSLSDQQQAELAAILDGDAQARRTYLLYMQDTASLRWISSGRLSHAASLPADRDATRPMAAASRRRRRTMAWATLATAAALAVVAANLWAPPTNETKPIASAGATSRAAEPVVVATVTGLADVTWDGAAPPSLLSRVAVGRRLNFSAGTLELTFDTGAQVKVFGPAALAISSPMSILCSRGRVTTLVGESGKGFTIDTPKARIVDLGTEFGVDISEGGDTQVVVFQGSVDLSRGAAQVDAGAADKSWTRRLQQGDALLVGAAGAAQRVVSVQRTDFFPGLLGDAFNRARRTPVITNVQDNIRDALSAKCYQIVHGGLREDALCFADRSHQWNGLDESGLPAFLDGADYIMPFNDDKFISDLRVEVEIARPADCYVFLDDNMPTPKWLEDSFRDTGFSIGLDGAKTEWHRKNSLGTGPGESVDFVFSVWHREISEAGTVTLGGVNPPGEGFRSRGFNMYGIAVAPK